MLQDVFLFAGTVEQNIRLFDDGVEFSKIEESCKVVNADWVINKLPMKYRQEVGERGVSLSTGERQLLSFARALVFNPKILLLDEATSNIDPITERKIQEGMQHLLEGRTAIVIAHRLSTIRQIGRIVVLHKGRIVEEGTHFSLVKKRGIYYRLWRIQQLGGEVG